MNNHSSISLRGSSAFLALFIFLFTALLSGQDNWRGYLDCPNPNNSGCPTTNLAGAINVTGWVLSMYTVSKVSIYRLPVPGESNLVWIQDASFIAGARPDVAAAFPSYPNNDWGFGTLVLTNGLPDSNGDGGRGNGTYTLQLIAYDPYGNSYGLSQITITVNNRDSVLPFGTIDTPGEGGSASGTYTNFGWALAPQPYMIPTDGSTMQVYIDGQFQGNVSYNNYRSDIANSFPGLNNSQGAVGFFYAYLGPFYATNPYGNGLHTIGWTVYDNSGHGQGIGSRWFSVTATPLSEPVLTPPVYQPPPVSASPLTPPSPVSATNTNCNDASGAWYGFTDAHGNVSTYTIDTSGGILSSDSSWSYCGSVTPITGSRQGNGTWQINITNQVQNACGTFRPIISTMTPSCTTAAVTNSNGSATWTRSGPPGITVTADLMAGKINTQLAGQKTSNLTIAVNNSSGQRVLSIPHGPAQGGNSFSDSFRTLIPPGQQYGSVAVTWDTATATVTLPSFYTIGYTHFTQYNTPYQTACAGGLQAVSIINRMDSQSCYYQTTSLPSDFVTQVGVNGTGVMSNGTLLKSYGAGANNVCDTNGYPRSQTFFSVDAGGNPITKVNGSNYRTVLSDASGVGTALNNFNPPPGSVATDYCATQGAPPSQATCPSGMVTPSTYIYGDGLLLFDQSDNNDSRGLRSAQDLCPACGYQGTQSGSTPAHIDMYNGTSTACSGRAVADYGYYNTIRLR